MIKLEALEAIEKIAIQHCDPRELQKRYSAVLDDRTDEDRIEQELDSLKKLAAMAGTTISKETEDEYRRG